MPVKQKETSQKVAVPVRLDELKEGDLIKFSRITPKGESEERTAEFVTYVKIIDENSMEYIVGAYVKDDTHGEYLVCIPGYEAFVDKIKKIEGRQIQWVVLDVSKPVTKEVTLRKTERPKVTPAQPTTEYVKKTYDGLKVGDEVTVASDMGGPLGRYDFHGKVVGITNDAVMIEAPLTDEWKNFWKATLHSASPTGPYTIPLGMLGTDPFGWWGKMKSFLADKFGGWVSRVEIRGTKKGPVLRYILYKKDIEKGYIKALSTGKEAGFAWENFKARMVILAGKAEPIPAPGIAPEMEVTEVTSTPTKKELPPSKYGGRVVSKAEIEELKGKTNEELLNMISLNYGTPGVYGGYNWVGGARGLRVGRDVAILQILLNRILGTTIKEDGVYGDETAAAIKMLQEKLGVTPDGYFGIDTKTALGSYLATLEETREVVSKEEEEAPEEGVEKPPESKEVVGKVLRLTREIDRDYVKPPKGVTQLMDENFYVNTDAGWLSGKELVKKDVTEIDSNWEADKATAEYIASRENWKTRTLTRKNVGVFSWANTKKVLFPYLLASGQEFEFKTWEPLTLEDGTKIPAGKVIRGKVIEYDEASGEFKVEVLAVQDEFTVKGGGTASTPSTAGGTATEVSTETAAKYPPLGEGMGGEEIEEEEG